MNAVILFNAESSSHWSEVNKKGFIHTHLREKYSCYVAVGSSLFSLQCNGGEMAIMEEQNIEFRRRNGL